MYCAADVHGPDVGRFRASSECRLVLDNDNRHKLFMHTDGSSAIGDSMATRIAGQEQLKGPVTMATTEGSFVHVLRGLDILGQHATSMAEIRRPVII